ncbi:type II toxin-antitoxin system RelE/ParE family toxin [Niveispirillum sp. KHB5.9]|uniref:type II toxin-antitoxin system RelE/ParE family toxin n=1 Tax=Niveispirillum sp. KHB5.9 TaxID=3400269 RepID=UPI003A89A130
MGFTKCRQQAIRDFFQIFDESQERWGSMVAEETAYRLTARCRGIAEGRAIGHARRDLPSIPWLFLNEAPFVIVYDPADRLVIRILHQARDMPRLIR